MSSTADVGRLLQEGQFAAAKILLQKICTMSPDNADAWHNLAVATARLGQLAEAQASIKRAVDLRPDHSQSLLLAANIYQDSGQLNVALACVNQIRVSDAAFAQSRNLAGILLADMGCNEESEAAFREAVRVNPSYARAFGNLAGACLRNRRPQEALTAAHEAIRLQPEYAHAHYIAASACLLLGEATKAIEALQNAIRFQPGFVDALLMLARIFRQQQAIDSALEAVHRALAIAPARMDARLMLADFLSARGSTTEAREAYQSVLEERPNHLEAALRQALILPVAYRDERQIDDAREAFSRGLDSLIRRQQGFMTLPPAELLVQLQYSNFYLAYQGRDDLPLQKRFAEFESALLSRVLPQHFRVRMQAPVRGRRLRVGFLSRFFYDSTAGNYFASWITDLDRTSFEVFVFYTHTQNDRLTERIRARADVFAPFEPDFAALAAQVSSSNLDVLVYPELGMDAKAFTLAALRLAPVQVSGWGHPVTTGHGNIDYFLSCSEMEPANAAEHYSESLALLPGLGTRYALPVLAPEFGVKTRADYQLPLEKTLYFSPQSLFKIHPDNDALLVDILQRDPHGVLVMFAGQADAARKIFMERLQAAFAAKGLAAQGRVRILPDVSHADYQRINELCDVMLDSLHWSGGNTSLDALAFGLPVVTLPGKFMRGRQSMAMLRMLGCEELIAKDTAEYVEIATSLGRDSPRRKMLSRRILDARSRLFDDTTPVAAFSDFLRRVTNWSSSTAANENK